ncbi:hypothetical protein [Labilibacter marinus]|uniref:hypothetical protein n=1 Tax=Labilibacter marinus TaxID=1477105 RepID=UPI00082C36AF|nr:hypothetical protein [Labilibacter marinus]
MKKVLIITIIALAFVLNANAQSNWELGGRFGNDFALDMTIPLAKTPRLHGALNFDNNISMGAYFDWMFALEDGPSGFKLYPGVGPELYFNNGLDVAAAGDFGMEYSFDFPLTIGFDWRPHFMLTNKMKFNSNNWGLIARFRFGKGVKLVKAN